MSERFQQEKNDLATLCPDLAKEWHPTKNGSLTPEHVMCGSDKKVWWLLKYDDPITKKHFDFEWEASINSRVHGKSCPYLSGKKVWIGYNDLATLYPDVAKEWHPTKNGDLTPENITINSGKKVWWQILYTDELSGATFWLEWQCRVSDRINGGRIRGCPYLYPKNRLLRGFNDLATTHPDLAKEWHPTKNGKLTPSDVTAYSKYRAWWITSIKRDDDCGFVDYVWQTQVNNRRLGKGFPLSCDSFGERCVNQYLKTKGFQFCRDKTFVDLHGVGNGDLSYDFYIKNIKVLIEYQGRQHYKIVEMFGGEDYFKIQTEHDKRKREYAKKHGYVLIEIPFEYDTYDKIASFLNLKLLELEKTLD